MDFVHPTGSQPKRVIMLLLGESKADYANALAVAHDPPPFHPEAEIWTCNAGFRIWQHDLVFVMDDLEGEAFKWPQYGTELKDHDKPIITSTVYPPWAEVAEPYPFEEICKTLGLQGFDRYFFNTVPYMLAYALAIGVKHVTIFGADYFHPAIGNAREGDIENAHWWLGFLRGRGVGLSIAQNSTLMGMRNAGRPLYGYRHDPRIAMDRKQRALTKQCTEPKQTELDQDELSAGALALIEGRNLTKTEVDKAMQTMQAQQRRREYVSD